MNVYYSSHARHTLALVSGSTSHNFDIVGRMNWWSQLTLFEAVLSNYIWLRLDSEILLNDLVCYFIESYQGGHGMRI